MQEFAGSSGFRSCGRMLPDRRHEDTRGRASRPQVTCSLDLQVRRAVGRSAGRPRGRPGRSAIVPDPQHVHEIYIRTTPERLWQALTDPALTAGYYRGCAVRSSWQPGAAYDYTARSGTEVTGQI